MARRTKAKIDHVKLCIYQLCREMQPMTVRQVFYQLTTLGVINNRQPELGQRPRQLGITGATHPQTDERPGVTGTTSKES